MISAAYKLEPPGWPAGWLLHGGGVLPSTLRAKIVFEMCLALWALHEFMLTYGFDSPIIGVMSPKYVEFSPVEQEREGHLVAHRLWPLTARSLDRQVAATLLFLPHAD
ncbi:MAG: hypothetical protein HY645_01375 [Acidobacteria bacterium]|nr:hypothetical protein [Acidobacteriota bacterium]